MKKIIRTSYLLLITAILLSSCGEESNVEPPPGPDIVLVTEGYLCTIGPKSDTLYYRYFGSGQELAKYSLKYAEKDYQIHLTSTGNNTMRVEMKKPRISMETALKYLGVYYTEFPNLTSFPNHNYQFQLYSEAIPETEFVIERNPDDIHQFTIESTRYKGQYLTTGKWKGNLGSDHPNLVFETGKKYWFFM